MKQNLLSILIALVLAPICSIAREPRFIENKGQMHDQFSRSRNDILYAAETDAFACHFMQQGYAIQLYKYISAAEGAEVKLPFGKKSANAITGLSLYRIDMQWIGASNNALIEANDVLPGYENFYQESCPSGALNVKSYARLTYKNLYNGIDVKWYTKNNRLKYDYVVSAGADYSAIKWSIEGAESISVNKKGELEISTPMGLLIEEAPYVSQAGRALQAKWQVNGKVVSFSIIGANKTETLLIDPLVRLWGTYYGGNAYEELGGIYADPFGNAYVAGSTLSANTTNIATTGAHQTNYGGGVTAPGYPGDAILVKMSSTGARLWATYYGGSGYEYGNRCRTDNVGNIYLVGGTTSTNAGVIATGDGHQQIMSATNGSLSGDGFVVKFNSAGVRIWGTYYGDSNDDWCTSIDIDRNNNLFVAGTCWSGPGVIPTLSTTGCHQPTHSGGSYQGDAILTKFQSNGIRVWSTYYGGVGSENGTECVADTLGNVYLTGNTTSSLATIFASAGAYQATYGGTGPQNLGDAFIAKFDGSGTRLWGTFYGGINDDIIYNAGLDPNNNLVVFGTTFSSIGTTFASATAFQPNYGGGNCDGFMARFSPNGARRYGSYYGGGSNEELNTGCVSKTGAIFMMGCAFAGSTPSLITCGAYQSTHGGGFRDAFIARFDSTGTRKWGTMFGGAGDEYQWCSISANANNEIYCAGMSGTAASSLVLTSSGAYQTTFGGGTSDLFIEKFDACLATPPLFNSTYNACIGQKAVIQGAANCGLKWYSDPTLNNFLFAGGAFTTNVLYGDTTFYVTDQSCGLTSAPAIVQLTAAIAPTVTIATGNTFVCVGETITLTPQGANTYTWTGNTATLSLVLTPSASANYTVTGSVANGCKSTATIGISYNACLSINSNDLSTQIKFFPNPTQQKAKLEVPEGSLFSLKAVNGAVIWTDKRMLSSQELDFTGLSKGLYIGTVSTVDAYYVFKIVLQD